MLTAGVDSAWHGVEQGLIEVYGNSPPRNSGDESGTAVVLVEVLERLGLSLYWRLEDNDSVARLSLIYESV